VRAKRFQNDVRDWVQRKIIKGNFFVFFLLKKTRRKPAFIEPLIGLLELMLVMAKNYKLVE